MTSTFSTILLAVASLLGSLFMWKASKWLAGWANEAKNKQLDKDAADGRTKADASDQKLNDEFKKLPKD